MRGARSREKGRIPAQKLAKRRASDGACRKYGTSGTSWSLVLNQNRLSQKYR